MGVPRKLTSATVQPHRGSVRTFKNWELWALLLLLHLVTMALVASPGKEATMASCHRRFQLASLTHWQSGPPSLNLACRARSKPPPSLDLVAASPTITICLLIRLSQSRRT